MKTDVEDRLYEVSGELEFLHQALDRFESMSEGLTNEATHHVAGRLRAMAKIVIDAIQEEQIWGRRQRQETVTL